MNLKILFWEIHRLLQLTRGVQGTKKSQKEAYTLMWSVIFVTAAQGTPPGHLTLVASRTYACCPSELHIFAYS